mmetsp:Transcript_11701/g.18119  ORF Transcript_11701/g.18119 Transcript_11701/m.18119 type:complete len:659 (+) Transcript_11701:59-2035(+)
MPPIKLTCKAIKAVARDVATEVKMSNTEECRMAVCKMKEQTKAMEVPSNPEVLAPSRPFARSHLMPPPYPPVPPRIPYAPRVLHSLQRPWVPPPGGMPPPVSNIDAWEMDQMMYQEARVRARARARAHALAEVEFEAQARAEYEAEVYARAKFQARAQLGAQAQLGARAHARAHALAVAESRAQIPPEVHREHVSSAMNPMGMKPAPKNSDNSVPAGMLDGSMKVRHEEYKAKQDAWLQKALDQSISRYQSECGGELSGPAKPEHIKSDVMWDELFLDHHAKPGVSLSGKQPRPKKKTWNENFTRLTEYLEKYPGDWMVLTLQHEPEWRTLHFWARDQRKFMNKGTLPPERAARLKSIGFQKTKSICYFPKSRNYISKINGAAEKQPNGETKNNPKPTAASPAPIHTASTAATAVKCSASASPSKVPSTIPTVIPDKPKAVPPTGERRMPHVIPRNGEPTWDTMFKRLVDFYVNNGHSNISKVNCRDTELLEWVLLQRSPRAEIDSVKRSRLESIGFIFDMDQHKWEANFKRLLDFKTSYAARGLSMEELILFAMEEEDLELYSWVNDQRVAEWQGDLAACRKEKLESAGVPWFKNSFKWYKMYDQLVHFKQALGHTKVPSTTTLGKWLQRQRRNPADVTAEQKRFLFKLGVTFSAKR